MIYKLFGFIGVILICSCNSQKNNYMELESITRQVENGSWQELSVQERLKRLSSMDYKNSNAEDAAEMKNQAVLLWQTYTDSDSKFQYQIVKLLANYTLIDNNYFDSLNLWRIAKGYEPTEKDCVLYIALLEYITEGQIKEAKLLELLNSDEYKNLNAYNHCLELYTTDKKRKNNEFE